MRRGLEHSHCEILLGRMQRLKEEKDMELPGLMDSERNGRRDIA